MKDCGRCGEIKEEIDFYFDNRLSSLRSICKDCDKEYAAEYYNNNIIEYRSKAREFYHLKKQAKLQASKEWFDKNPEKLKEYNKSYQNSELYQKQKKLSYLRLKMKEMKISFKEFIAKIESELPETESWDNYKKTWEIICVGDKNIAANYKIRFF